MGGRIKCTGVPGAIISSLSGKEGAEKQFSKERKIVESCKFVMVIVENTSKDF